MPKKTKNKRHEIPVDEVAGLIDKVNAQLKRVEQELVAELTDTRADLSRKSQVASMMMFHTLENTIKLKRHMNELYDDVENDEITDLQYWRFADYMLRSGLTLLKIEVFGNHSLSDTLGTTLMTVVYEQETGYIGRALGAESLNLKATEIILRHLIVDNYTDFLPASVIERLKKAEDEDA